MESPESRLLKLEQELRHLQEEKIRLLVQLSELEASCSDLEWRRQQQENNFQEQFRQIQEEIDHLKKSESLTQQNKKNIAFLRNIGLGLIAAMSLASAWDWNEGISFHGDRWQSLVTALAGAGGLAFLGFRKIEVDDKNFNN